MIDWIINWIPGTPTGPRKLKWYRIGFTEGIVGALASFYCLYLLPTLITHFVPENSEKLFLIFILLVVVFIPLLLLHIIKSFLVNEPGGKLTLKWWTPGFFEGTAIIAIYIFIVKAGALLFDFYNTGDISGAIEAITYAFFAALIILFSHFFSGIFGSVLDKIFQRDDR
ncbi:hypothetical protein PN36_25590 [Candidatus Thiomargarita nelsonii]|uniref:Uncharacterized protein n=1 Tax=Candidatus Thiomargarita nelsonii TaxID=1003181 RepID=A0A4E0RPR0_9GAMM|nr:hypothetical protein PN36_25590 [Candidatus Thiomargarita nelsonii]